MNTFKVQTEGPEQLCAILQLSCFDYLLVIHLLEQKSTQDMVHVSSSKLWNYNSKCVP